MTCFLEMVAEDRHGEAQCRAQRGLQVQKVEGLGLSALLLIKMRSNNLHHPRKESSSMKVSRGRYP